MQYHRTQFPAVSVYSKLHILEDYVVPWFRAWQVCLALHSEQGGESLHAMFNREAAVHRNIKHPLQRLVSTTKAVLMKCDPIIQMNVPVVKEQPPPTILMPEL